MNGNLTLSQLNTLFPNEDACLEEIKRRKYPYGVYCESCKRNTKHYKLNGRPAYSCKFCRSQIYPLSGTIFEKSTTPLRVWFFALFLMTHTRATISAKKLQSELGVTYKTAWRMKRFIKMRMEENHGDLLRSEDERLNRVYKWVLFNKIEFKLVQTQESKE